MTPARVLRSTITGLVVLCLSGTASAAADDAGGHAAGIDRGSQFSPIVSDVLTRPTAEKATDGRFHIAYELVLTNTAPLTMAVERLEVRTRAPDESWPPCPAHSSTRT